jgi:hypothetical protein
MNYKTKERLNLENIKRTNKKMSIVKIVFGKEYIGNLEGRADWVAGGNFDGYIKQSTLVFHSNKTVIKKTNIVDDTRYDGVVQGNESIGRYSETDKKAIECEFDNFSMLGYILGGEHQYLIFTVISKKNNYTSTECYQCHS